MKIAEIIGVMEIIAPAELAAEWDNVGLQVGSMDQDVSAVMLALDVTEEVIEETAEKGAGLIISHHPVIFGDGLKSVNNQSREGRLVRMLIERNISLFVAHTNFDSAERGTNFQLAKMFSLENCRPLRVESWERLHKLVVFVPRDHAEKLREAICGAGAGHIGRYSDCTFMTPGTGTFKGDDGSTPFIGEPGKLELAAEFRLETIFRVVDEEKIIAAMLAAHPYEEVAYDIYPLENVGATFGMGCIAELPEKELAYEFLERVKEKLDAPVLLAAGNLAKYVKTVGICGGSGAELIEDAIRQGCDIFITAELKHHHGLANTGGMILAGASHYSMESIFVPAMAGLLSEPLAGMKVITAEKGKDPFTFI